MSKKEVFKVESIDKLINEQYSAYMSASLPRNLMFETDLTNRVGRRIIFQIEDQSEFIKSARITGEILGKYHPHGESSVYDAIGNMATGMAHFPLIEGEGNWGNKKKRENPAANRYTKMNIHKNLKLCLDYEAKKTRIMINNYEDDGRTKEPYYILTKIPLGLLTTNTAPSTPVASSHYSLNAKELIKACAESIKCGYKLTAKKAMKHLKGPDHRLYKGLIVKDEESWYSILEKGVGTIYSVPNMSVDLDEKVITIIGIPHSMTFLNGKGEETFIAQIEKTAPEGLIVNASSSRERENVSISFRDSVPKKVVLERFHQIQERLKRPLRYNVLLSYQSNIETVGPSWSDIALFDYKAVGIVDIINNHQLVRRKHKLLGLELKIAALKEDVTFTELKILIAKDPKRYFNILESSPNDDVVVVKICKEYNCAPETANRALDTMTRAFIKGEGEGRLMAQLNNLLAKIKETEDRHRNIDSYLVKELEDIFDRVGDPRSMLLAEMVISDGVADYNIV